MNSKLHKYEATGNDFLVISNDSPYATPAWAPQLCDRKRGVGADGILVVTLEESPRMVIFNADGSRPEMCGNGVRCVAAYLRDHSPMHRKMLEKGDPLTVISDAGPRDVYLDLDDKHQFRVDMGVPQIKPEPTCISECETHPELLVYEVDMGNPHAVCLDEKFFNDHDLRSIGHHFNQKHPSFPRGVNFEIVDLSNRNVPTKARVFERGVGETLACGTGACAVAVTLIRLNLIDSSKVDVSLPGGTLKIEWKSQSSTVMMTGPAHFIATLEPSTDWTRRCERGFVRTL